MADQTQYEVVGVKISNNIKSLRQEKGLTQAELANILSVSKNTLFNWENERIPISAPYIILLADFFNVSTDKLLGVQSPNYNYNDLILIDGTLYRIWKMGNYAAVSKED